MTISDRLKQKFGSSKRGVVRALRNEIEHALSEHWTAKQIWEDLFLKGSIECSYRTFCRHLGKESIGKKSRAPVVKDFLHRNVIDGKEYIKNEQNSGIKKFVFERLEADDLI